VRLFPLMRPLARATRPNKRTTNIAARPEDPEGDLGGVAAKTLWDRLAEEMRAARQAAGIRPTDWGNTPDVPWTRSHLSNLEHGRGKPTAEVAALYDEKCPRAGKPTFFRSMQAAAAAADEREKGPAVRRDEDHSATRDAAIAVEVRPAKLRAARRWGALFVAAALGLALAVTLVMWNREDSSPASGQRTVCARDLILRDAPGPTRGGDPRLYRGETIEIDRFAEGPEGPHMYAHGTSQGREARGEGWVTEKYLCR